MQTPIGVQIWSLKNLLQVNPQATLEKIALAGYSFIEPAGFNVQERTMQGFYPVLFKQMAGDLGLDIVSGHFRFNKEDCHIACNCAAEMGMKYLVHFFLETDFEQTIDKYKEAALYLNYIAETAKSFGLQLAYHNHAHEFKPIDGIVPFDILLQRTNPALVSFQIDLGWMAVANHSPQQYFIKYPSRFPLWHLRDIDSQTKKSTSLGCGVVDFKAIYAEKEMSGLQYAIVEISSDTENPLEKILNSYDVVHEVFCL